MPCYHPLQGWRSGTKNPSGRRSITFRPRDGIPYQPLQVPCGQCIGCKLERSRQWAIRCVHEAQLHQENCFITLTYDDAHLPLNPRTDGDHATLIPLHFVLFMKRLRKSLHEKPVRFFHCGEYGESLGRPHHHAILFGHNFADRVHHSGSGSTRLYRSVTLEKLWPFGFSTIGEATFQSAAYIARYCTKKITGPPAEAHYQGRHPEYITMSRRPGIGNNWIWKYFTDVYPSDQLVIRGGVITKPPRYYDDFTNALEPDTIAKIKQARTRAANNSPDNTGRRLTDRGDAQQLTAAQLKRNFENGAS